MVFDLKGLSSFPDLQAVMILIITDFILGRVESNNPKIALKKKRILMDECWELLKGKSSSHFMEYCVRTLRKTGSGITFITQGIEEIYNHPIGSVILGNTATKFILQQKGDLKPLEDLLSQLKRALTKLTLKQKTVIKMIFWERLSEREIASKLSLSRNAVVERKNQAIQKLRKVLRSKTLSTSPYIGAKEVSEALKSISKSHFSNTISESFKKGDSHVA